MARSDPQINLRVPEDLKKRLEIQAIENSRSLNAEVVRRLEESFKSNQDMYATAFADASVKIISHVITSLQSSGLSNDQVLNVLRDMKFNAKE